MILADTSVWIDHLRSENDMLTSLLNNNQIVIHPFVIGELACGNFRDRAGMLLYLRNLPMASIATDAEVLFFIEQQKLMGQGIGYMDAHLVATTILSASVSIWTHDKALQKIADTLHLAYSVN